MEKSKHKQHIWIFLMIFFILSGIGILIGIFVNFELYKAKGTFVWYNEAMVAANENYVGFIDAANDKVRIITHSGAEVSCVDTSDTKEGNPDQIFLGEHSYFLQYCGDNPCILQYDYQSDRLCKYVALGEAMTACRDGYIFLSKWGKDGGRGFSSFHDGFYADGYVKESELENQPRPLIANQSGRCRAGGVELYHRKGGFYCTEPDIGDYPGMSWGEFWTDEGEDHYRADTKREEKNRALVADTVDKTREGRDTFCEVCEYQKDRFIYGICNSYSVHITSAHPAKQENVIRSYAYRIDPDKEEITILGQEKNCIGIVVSGAVFVYQKDNEIIQEDMKTGEKKVIYHIKNIYGPGIYVNGDYLLVTERDKNLLSGKQGCYPVRWKEKP